MEIRDFKQYSVIVDGGSGVLFQPITNEYFYILTAKHNLQIKNDAQKYVDKVDGTQINIVRFILEEGMWSNDLIPFQLVKEQNYFPHPDENVDLAILKIPFNSYRELQINNLYISSITSVNNDAYLCGFPNDKRLVNYNDYQMQFTNYVIQKNTNDGINVNSAIVSGNQSQDTILGMSGGAIVKINHGNYELIGIQSQFTRTISEQSEIDFFSMKFFKQIIDDNPGKLTHLLPSYLTSFEFLITEILRLEEALPELIPKLKSAISHQLNNVTTNPVEICNKNVLNKLLTKKANDNNLHSKDFWISCLEYLLVLSLLQDKIIDIDALLAIIDEKRFLHSDTNLSWIQILPEILNSDIRDLKDGATLIVSTKKIPSGKKRLNTKYIQDITDPQIDFTIDRASSIKKIKEIIHIKAFEIDCFISNEDSLNIFKAIEIEELITELKKIINEFFES